MTTIYCVVCGTQFESRTTQSKYCSSKCKSLHYRQIKKNCCEHNKIVTTSVCMYCGNTFTYERSKTNYSIRKFCTKEHRYKWQSENSKGKSIDEKYASLPTKVCKHCGKEFTCESSYTGKVFCSKNCQIEYYKSNYNGENHHNWQGGDIELICEICKKPFHVKKSMREQRFCSIECRSIWQSETTDKNNLGNYTGKTELVNVRCSNCNNIIDRHKHLIKFRKYFFCDDLCKSEYYKKYGTHGNTTNSEFVGHTLYHYTFFYPKNRNRVLKYYSHTCVVCGLKDESGHKLEVHHVNEEEHFLPFEEAKYVILCNSCHLAYHSSKSKEMKLLFLQIIDANGGKCFD